MLEAMRISLGGTKLSIKEAMIRNLPIGCSRLDLLRSFAEYYYDNFCFSCWQKTRFFFSASGETVTRNYLQAQIKEPQIKRKVIVSTSVDIFPHTLHFRVPYPCGNVPRGTE